MFRFQILLITFIMALISYLIALLFNFAYIGAQSAGNGTYTNPILNAVGADP